MPVVFCYGTLKKGYSNHRLVESQEYLGEAETAPEYRLFDCGPFPCMIESKEDGVSVKGELYRVDEKTMTRLDRLEGVPFLYNRAELKMKNRDETVIGYLYQRDVSDFEDCGSFWPDR